MTSSGIVGIICHKNCHETFSAILNKRSQVVLLNSVSSVEINDDKVALEKKDNF